MRDGMRDKYGYHEMKEHAGKDFPFNIYPAPNSQVIGFILLTLRTFVIVENINHRFSGFFAIFGT